MNKIFDDSKTYWKEEVVRGNLRWPDPHIIRFLNRKFKKELRSNVKVLDFGCGAGRNAIALQEEGYKVIAMDYNEKGLELLKQKSKEDIRCIVNAGVNIPLEDESVDSIIASGSLMYCNKDERVELLKNLKKVLKFGGLFWSDWRSDKDSLCKAGRIIEKNYYLLNEDSRGRNGVAYYFTNKKDLEELYKEAGLSIVSIDVYSYSENNGENINSWYHVIAER